MVFTWKRGRALPSAAGAFPLESATWPSALSGSIAPSGTPGFASET